MIFVFKADPRSEIPVRNREAIAEAVFIDRQLHEIPERRVK
jgi:hypothetical protein